jgi:hypothetical protein
VPNFVVNKHPQWGSDVHEVHDSASRKECLPDPDNQVALGEFSHCAEALAAARLYFPQVDGCFFCTPECHAP